MKLLIRNSIQKILILGFNLVNELLNKKIVLFSRFMSKHKSDYILKRGKISKCDYVLNVHDIAVARRIYIGLDDEHLKTKKALKWIKELTGNSRCQTIFDIGANIGHISIPLLVDNTISKSYLWEPDPENFKLLKCNIILNDLETKVNLFRYALGNKEKTLIMELSEDNYGDHRIQSVNDLSYKTEKKRNTIAIPAKQLDSFVDHDLNIDDLLVWIDVQGFEAKVLEGAHQLLHKKPALCIEFWPYGLENQGGIEPLMSVLSNYSLFYDLATDDKNAEPLCTLEKLYAQNYQADSFTMDILLVN